MIRGSDMTISSNWTGFQLQISHLTRISRWQRDIPRVGSFHFGYLFHLSKMFTTVVGLSGSQVNSRLNCIQSVDLTFALFCS